MKIILYSPEGEEARRELARQTALVHAQTVLELLDALDCSGEERGRLLEAVLECAGGA